MNTERMLKLATFIENLPAHKFQMSYWAIDPAAEEGHRDIDPKALNPHQCKTQGCIAGWAIHLFADRAAGEKNYYNSSAEEARGLLGLDSETAHRLFLRHSIISRADAADAIRELVAEEET